jgi:DNA-binding NarL/FixJ family response regulator
VSFCQRCKKELWDELTPEERKRRIVERGRMAHVKARENGKRSGRPLKRDDVRIAQLRAKGLSIRKIAAALEVSKGVVQNSLKQVKMKDLK